MTISSTVSLTTYARVTADGLVGSVDVIAIGDARIYRIADIADIAWPIAAMFRDLKPEALRAIADRLPPASIDLASLDSASLDSESDKMRLSFNSFVISTPGFTALIDTGIGNGKERLDRPAWHQRFGTFLSDLSALGFPPERFDLVVNTHLHADHVGWNTVAAGASWRPTFPRARYIVPQTELAYWRSCADAEGAEAILHGAYADSVLPLLEAGVLETVKVPAQIAPNLYLEPAPGHSPGMAVVRFSSSSGDVVFLADVIHHPLQLALREVGSNFCEDPALAAATRDRILNACANTPTIVAPYHFPSPAFGHVLSDGSDLKFQPLAESET